MHTTQDSPTGSSGQTVSFAPLFTLTATEEGNAHAICAEGELDLYECPRLERALQKAEASRAIRILLNLEKLTFIDAAGLSVLVMAYHRSMSNGNRLRVTRARGTVADMFHLTALDRVLPFIRA